VLRVTDVRGHAKSDSANSTGKRTPRNCITIRKVTTSDLNVKRKIIRETFFFTFAKNGIEETDETINVKVVANSFYSVLELRYIMNDVRV